MQSERRLGIIRAGNVWVSLGSFISKRRAGKPRRLKEARRQRVRRLGFKFKMVFAD